MQKTDFDIVEGYQLDYQQIESIRNDNHNTLVIAGAGTGKTTTIIGKVKYILQKWQEKSALTLQTANPNRLESTPVLNLNTLKDPGITLKNLDIPRILLISFTHASKEELRQRVLQETLQDDLIFNMYGRIKPFVVETFHSLALRILQAQHLKIKLTEVDFKEYLLMFYEADFKQKSSNNIIGDRATGCKNIRKLLLDFCKEKASDEYTIDEIFTEVVDLLDHLYEMMRNYNLEISELKNRNLQKYKHRRTKELFSDNQKIIEILETVQQGYQEFLMQNNLIDFPGLIERAIKEVLIPKPKQTESNKPNPANSFCYDYVIIDEYQDISPLEYQLIKTLRELHDFRLFCVGDDWQTIYQFAGSEIGLILDFAKYWGETKIYKIENTYRFSNLIAKASSEFIMKNPAQLEKNIHGSKEYDSEQIIEINGPSERTDLDSLYYFFLDLPPESSILLLGRYNFDLRKISHCNFLKLQNNYSSSSGETDNIKISEKINNEKASRKNDRIIFPERNDLRIKFLSVHKSKGLQADYIFLINCRDGTLGFPSKLAGKSLIKLITEQGMRKDIIQGKVKSLHKDTKVDKVIYKSSDKNINFSEERRLFYVAMTRTKKKLFLLTVRGKESIFIEELREKMQQKMITYKIT